MSCCSECGRDQAATAGRFARDNCPTYLQPRHFAALKAGGLDRLDIVTSTFMEQLLARTYTKVGSDASWAAHSSFVTAHLCVSVHS